MTEAKEEKKGRGNERRGGEGGMEGGETGRK